jgi:hypothetical protein
MYDSLSSYEVKTVIASVEACLYISRDLLGYANKRICHCWHVDIGELFNKMKER